MMDIIIFNFIHKVIYLHYYKLKETVLKRDFCSAMLYYAFKKHNKCRNEVFNYFFLDKIHKS